MPDSPLERIDHCRYRLPKNYKSGMRVDGILYTSAALLPDLTADNAVEQLANMCFLPGIVGPALAMPDMHWGYGFPIGGVAATDVADGGVISPGGVGFDINCGVRLLRTNLCAADITARMETLVNALYAAVPSGVGSVSDMRLSAAEEKKLMSGGAAWAVSQGHGTAQDLAHTEAHGCLADADPDVISPEALQRGRRQAGTLGSGNHFLEIQQVDEVLDQQAAQQLRLTPGRIAVMIHTGSRGFGHQVCTDALKLMQSCWRRYAPDLPDRQLACAPVHSAEGSAYLTAMRCAANYAWANRQLIMQRVREVFAREFGCSWEQLDMALIYDLAHNIASIEQHQVNGRPRTVCVHRKGATRAFGPGHSSLPDDYRQLGQPVIIPGDMGRASYVLLGTDGAQRHTFGSCCHGAGRRTSRAQAIRTITRAQVLEQLRRAGVSVRAANKQTLVEEAPQVYKNIADVVDVVQQAGIGRVVCRLRPLGVIKG